MRLIVCKGEAVFFNHLFNQLLADAGLGGDLDYVGSGMFLKIYADLAVIIIADSFFHAAATAAISMMPDGRTAWILVGRDRPAKNTMRTGKVHKKTGSGHEKAMKRQ